MGDGSVGLILDLNGIAKIAGFTSSASKAEQPSKAEDFPTQSQTSDDGNFLLFKAGSKALFGVPLAQVYRLEELDPENVQWSGGERVVIYRDNVMRLLSFGQLMNLNSVGSGPEPGNGGRRIPTIVAKAAEGFFGLEVETVIDIAEAEAKVSPEIRDRRGIVGNTFIREQNVTVVDLTKIIGNALSA
jgi:two-component system chemotaxis sensor kinase CheA